MYVVTINDNVILGPIEWNPRLISSAITDELESEYNIAFDANVSFSDKDLVPISLAYGVKIRECVEIKPPLNSKTFHYQGPVWSFTDLLGTAEYLVEGKNIEFVKQQLSEIVAANRYKREVQGTTATVQGQTVSIDTSRGIRDVFVQQYLLISKGKTVHWKFPEGWFDLTRDDLNTCVTEGMKWVQDAFVWESTKVAEIQACTTLQELDSIILEYTE